MRLRIWLCRELWCRSQMRLGYRAAVAQASSCSSDSASSLGTSTCLRCSPKNRKKKKKKKKRKEIASQICFHWATMGTPKAVFFSARKLVICGFQKRGIGCQRVKITSKNHCMTSITPAQATNRFLAFLRKTQNWICQQTRKIKFPGGSGKSLHLATGEIAH